MYDPSGTQMNVPCFNVTPLNPMDDNNDALAWSKIAETTASALTTNPRNLPVLADVFDTTTQPVYPALNELALILIPIKRLDGYLFHIVHAIDGHQRIVNRIYQ